MRSHVSAAVLLLVLASTALAAKAPAPSREDIAWLAGYHQGLALAKEKRTPVLLRVEPRSRCEPCRDMEWRVWSHPDVVELSKRFTCIRMDTAVYAYLLNRLRIREIPTMLILDPDGAELHRLRGYTTSPLLLDTMRKTLEALERPSAAEAGTRPRS
jgi:hypothetical protein